MELGQTVNTLSHNKLYTNLYNPRYAWSVVSDLRLSERCYNVALACGNYDHTNSVAKVIMTIKKGRVLLNNGEEVECSMKKPVYEGIWKEF